MDDSMVNRARRMRLLSRGEVNFGARVKRARCVSKCDSNVEMESDMEVGS